MFTYRLKKKSYIIIYNGGYVLLCDLRYLSSYNCYAREKKPMALKRAVFFLYSYRVTLVPVDESWSVIWRCTSIQFRTVVCHNPEYKAFFFFYTHTIERANQTDKQNNGRTIEWKKKINIFLNQRCRPIEFNCCDCQPGDRK